MTFSCGCAPTPAKPDDYCRTHWSFGCHTNGNQEQGLCPPCRIAKWRSVSLSSAATPRFWELVIRALPQWAPRPLFTIAFSYWDDAAGCGCWRESGRRRWQG